MSSAKIVSIVYSILIPKIHEAFSSFTFDPNDFEKPTKHLNAKLKENCEPFLRYSLPGAYKNLYKVDDIDEDYGVFLELTDFGMSICILDLDMFQNTPETNYISISRDTGKKLYIYGIKTNGVGPTVSGNVFNQVMYNICKEMFITQVFISDSASVQCYLDSNYGINHFSLMRTIIGKPTFYSSLPGHFFNQEAAQEEIEIVQSGTSAEDKQNIRDYLDKKNFRDTPHESCDEINNIIQKASELLPAYPELYKYVVTPYIPPKKGGKRNTKKFAKKRRRRTLRPKRRNRSH
jgi:hypothetical protein